jgi:hypothetical protein
MLTTEFAQGALLMSVALFGAFLVLSLTGRMPRSTTRVQDIEGMVRILQRDHIRDQERIEHLEQKLIEATARIQLLEQELLQYRAVDPGNTKRPPKPLLLVQCNRLFGEDDALAVRRTGIVFHRLKNCTGADFDRHLQAMRQDGTTPWWVQISAHMGPTGIEFTDGIKSVTWLSQRIRGLRILVLAGCENEEVAAQLSSNQLAKHVVAIYETIETQNAQDFTYAFWREIADGSEPPDAFAAALNECPQVSEFVLMRTARRNPSDTR